MKYPLSYLEELEEFLGEGHKLYHGLAIDTAIEEDDTEIIILYDEDFGKILHVSDDLQGTYDFILQENLYELGEL